MKNYKLILQYDGTRYSGWQKQGNTDNTIQFKLETIAEKLTGIPTDVNGSGRTDAGVHALGQVANFRCDESCLRFLQPHSPSAHIAKSVSPSCSATMTDTEYILRYFNNALPIDIRVLQVDQMPARFHSRLNAKEKHYRYVIDNQTVPNVFERRYAARIPAEHENRIEYDITEMNKAAAYLIGTHDFKSFCDNRHMKKSTVRTIRDILIENNNNRITLDFYGNGFLYHMVRILTGTLLEVGSGKKVSSDIPRILQALDRREAGFTAPAVGLFLVEVTY